MFELLGLSFSPSLAVRSRASTSKGSIALRLGPHAPHNYDSYIFRMPPSSRCASRVSFLDIRKNFPGIGV